MFRSGSTLQYNIAVQVAKAATGSLMDVGGGYGMWRRIDWLSEFSTSDDVTMIVKEHHYMTHAMEKTKLGPHCYFLYSFRDLRDVLVSLYQKGGQLSSLNSESNQWRGRMESILRGILYDCAHWTRQNNVLISRYEEVTANIQSEVKRISSHLKLPVSDADIVRIAEQVSLKNQMAYINSINFKDYGDGPMTDRYDPISLLHEKHFYGGESGKWKREFSLQQLEFIESIAGAWLQDHGYVVDRRK
jgi:hypothetical protein